MQSFPVTNETANFPRWLTSLSDGFITNDGINTKLLDLNIYTNQNTFFSFPKSTSTPISPTMTDLNNNIYFGDSSGCLVSTRVPGCAYSAGTTNCIPKSTSVCVSTFPIRLQPSMGFGGVVYVAAGPMLVGVGGTSPSAPLCLAGQVPDFSSSDIKYSCVSATTRIALDVSGVVDFTSSTRWLLQVDSLKASLLSSNVMVSKAIIQVRFS